jgi:hypothetical protein
MQPNVPAIPRPLPDELLYSVVARAARHLGYWGPKQVSGAVYGRRTVLASPDLPNSLALLERVANEAWGMTPEELAVRHTLVSYYTHFLGATERRRAIEDMLGTSRHLHLRLGICASSVIAPSRFRLCRQCTADDLARLGETYWRRSHHLPGVLACPHHGIALHECEVPFRPVGRHEHIAAHPDMLQRGQDENVDVWVDNDTTRQLAVRSAALLDGPTAAESGRHDYRASLLVHGYAGGRNGSARFRTAFSEAFGQPVLRSLFKPGPNGDALRWLDEVMRTPRRPLHPLKHVMLQQFLDGCAPREHALAVPVKPKKTWALYRDEKLRKEAAGMVRQGFSTCAVARALEVDWKTASRLIVPASAPKMLEQPDRGEQDRRAWAALVIADINATRSQLRKSSPALYARLYRGDRDWLRAQKPKPNATPAVRPARVDWAQRDRELCAQIEEQVSTTLAILPAVRASRHRILGALGRRAMFAHNGHKVPFATSALDKLCESVKQFQLRRLTSVIRQESASSPLPDWYALRQARIDPTRLADAGESLLRAARSGRPGASSGLL